MDEKTLKKRLSLRGQYRNNQTFRFLFQAICVIIGSIICGMCFPTFFRSADIIPSGFSGLSVILSRAIFGTERLTSTIYIIINVVLFVSALKLFGFKYIIFTLLGLAAYTLAMEFFAIPQISTPEASFPEFPDYRLLYALIGGGISGMGQGIAFRMGGSTGGSDIAANIINRLQPKIKTGVGVLIINVIVITITVCVDGWQTALYAVIVAVISTITCDMVLDGAKTVRAFYIICDKDEEIAHKILDRFHRGVTILPVQGAFSKKEKKMLLCLVANSQAGEMKEIVKSTDTTAFVFSTAVNETLGDGYFMKEVSENKRKIRMAEDCVKSNEQFSRLAAADKTVGKKFRTKKKYHLPKIF